MLLICSTLPNLTYGQVTAPDTIPNNEIEDFVSPEPLSPSDTIPDTIQQQEESEIETTIVYNARDSIRMDVITQTVYLYGNAVINYGDITLEAEYIEIDWVSNTLFATGLEQAEGRITGNPVFRDGDDMYQAKSIKYNFKTKRGIISEMITQEGEGYLHGEKIKKESDNSLYINHARYTTCNLAHPHFYIGAHKLKAIPDDKIVSGPFNIVIGDVPTPVGFFLGYFPSPKTRKSGIVFPSPGEDANRGFNIREGGYYWAIKDYAGVRLVGDVFSNGSWRTNMATQYIKRYSYSGNLLFNFSKHRIGFDDNLPFNEDFNLTWQHNSQGLGTDKFSANVNYGSSNFFRFNSLDPMAMQTGQLYSTVSYFKTFRNSPFNLGVTMNQNTNTSTNVATYTLPEVNFAMNRIFPFRGKVQRGNWYEKIGVQYNLNSKFQTTNVLTDLGSPDTVSLNGNNIGRIIANGQYGALHTTNISTSLKTKKTFLQYFNINPYFDFRDYWYPERLSFISEPDTAGIDRFETITHKGFYRTSAFNTGASLTTKINGFYQFNSRRITGMRHVIIPNLNYNYKPDFGEFGSSHTNTATSVVTNQDVMLERGPRSKYEGFIYGSPQRGTSNALTLSIDNSLEAKVRSRDTASAFQKISILDNFNINGSYNFAADSLKLSNINFTTRTRLFNRVDIFYQAIVDPYRYVEGADGRPVRINEYVFSERRLGQISGSNLSLSTSLNPKARTRPTSPDATPEQLAYIRSNPMMYVDFNIPWNLAVSFNYSYSKLGYLPKEVTARSITFMGDMRLTENWKVRVNTGYDMVRKAMALTRIDIDRDLHCWQMSFSIVPFGTQRSYFFTLAAKASLLQDLKLNKRSPNMLGGMF